MVRVARQPASTQAKYVTASMVTNPGNYNYDLSLETQALLASIVNPRGNVIIKPVVKLRRLKPEDLKQTVRDITDIPSNKVRKDIPKANNSLNGVLNGDVNNKSRVPTRNSARTKTKAELKSVDINGLESEPENKAKKPSADTNKGQEAHTRTVPKRIIRTRKRARRAPVVGAKTGLVQRVKPYLLKNKICKLNQKLETIRGKRSSDKEQEGGVEKEEEVQVDSVEEEQVEESEANHSASEDTQDTISGQDNTNSKENGKVQDSQDELDYECVKQRKPLVVKIRRKSEDIRAKRRSSRFLFDKSVKSASPRTSPEPIISQDVASASPNDKNSPGTPQGKRRTITNETRKKSIALLKANRHSQSPTEDRSLESNASSKSKPKGKSPNSKNSKTTPESKDTPMNAAPEQPIQNGNHQDNGISQDQDTVSLQDVEETASETSCPHHFRRPKYITKKSHILKRLTPFTTTGSWTGSISDLSDKPASSDSSMPGTPEEAPTQSTASTAETSNPDGSIIEDNSDVRTRSGNRTLQKETELPSEVIDKLTKIAEKDKNESAKDSDKSVKNKNNGEGIDSPESLLESELEKSTMAILGTIIKESGKATNEEQELPCLPDSTTVSDDLQGDLDLHDDNDSLDIPIFTASVAKHSKAAKATEMNANKDATNDAVSTCNVTESPSSKWKAIPPLVEERDKPGSKSQSVTKLIHRLSERISPKRSSAGSSGIQESSNPGNQMDKTDAAENETVVSSTSEHPDPQTDMIVNCVTMEIKSNDLQATNTAPKDSQQKSKPVGVAKRKRGPRKRLVQAAQKDNAINEQKKGVNENKIQTNATATAKDLRNQTGNTDTQSQSTIKTTTSTPQKSNQEPVKSKKASPRSGAISKRRTSTRTSVVHKSAEEHIDTVSESINKRPANTRKSTGHKTVNEKMDTSSETSSFKEVRLIVEDCAKRPPKISLAMGYTLNLAPIVKAADKGKSTDSVSDSEHFNNQDIVTTTVNNVPEKRARPKTKGKRTGKRTVQQAVGKEPEERQQIDEAKVKEAPASNKGTPTPRRGRPRKRKAATLADKNNTAQADNIVNTIGDENVTVSETRPLRKTSDRQPMTTETGQSKESAAKPVKQAKESSRISPRRSSPRGIAYHSERGPDKKTDKTVSPSPTRSSLRGKSKNIESETSKQISSEAISKSPTRSSSRGKGVEDRSSKIVDQAGTSVTNGTVSSTSKGPQKNSPRGRGSKKKTLKSSKISIRKSPENIIQRPKDTVEEIVDDDVSDVDSEATEILDLETLNEKLDEVNGKNSEVNDKDTADLNKTVPGRSLRQTSGRRALSVEKARLASVSSAEESPVREAKKTETRKGKTRQAVEEPVETRPVRDSKKRDAQSISEDLSPGRETRRTAASKKSTTISNQARGKKKDVAEIGGVEEDSEVHKSPVRKSRRIQSPSDVSPSSTSRKGSAKAPPAASAPTSEAKIKGKQPVRASKRVQDAEKGKQETKDQQETLPAIEPPRRTLRSRDKPAESSEKPTPETANKDFTPTRKTKLTETKAAIGTKVKVARRGRKAALTEVTETNAGKGTKGKVARQRGKAELTEVYIMEEEPETITAVHEETHHVKKKTIRDVTDMCVLHDGTLLLALTLKDDSMRRYADDMSLILWELPLSSLASGFEEIICEGISLLALSHHPPKDTAGVMKFRNMDEIELVEFTLILRAQDPSHFCKLPNGDMAYVDSGPKNCMLRYISCSMLPPKVDRTRPDVELHMQNNVSSVTCMQHNTQGELIIVAGNERISIYRTDTARLVSQVVGRIGGGLSPTSICCNLGPVIFTADTANQKILSIVYYGDSHSLRFNNDIVSNGEHGIGAPHTIAWDRKNSRLVVYHLLPAMISTYSIEYTWNDTVSDT